ncbi:MAG: flavin reductase family protein [Chitinophagaceae bacterium]|jgi:flavin reductase (DIM6/NTAB) family NADH-FMN oxidoreductase RutF|nr:flavin reductase family protein [Chitinophagaceae bacterium]
MPKRPWNRIDLPVYASCSTNGAGDFNMHIITYASQISMQPKRYFCGIYEGTKTLDLVQQYPVFVLQLLSAQQYRLVDLLGKQSGHDTNKIARLEKRGLLIQWQGFPVLKDALAYIQLKIIGSMEAGDHSGFLCDVQAWKNQQEGDVLTLNILRQHKMIRI